MFRVLVSWALSLPQGKNKHILVAIDYVSKWVEVIASFIHDAKVVTKFFKRVIIFPRFGV